MHICPVVIGGGRGREGEKKKSNLDTFRGASEAPSRFLDIAAANDTMAEECK